MSAKSVSCQVAALTHRGAVRDHNEDFLAVNRSVLGGDMDKPSVWNLVDGSPQVLMVADGMGGHAHGGLASRVALESLVSEPTFFENEATCSTALLAANDRIYDLMQLRPDALGMGTTIVGVALKPPSLIHFNVGDSRIYRHVADRLVRLSHDDVPSGATNTPRRASHLITQSLGGQPSRIRIAPHIAVAPPLQRGEVLLLCSDGLTDMVDEKEISGVLDNMSSLDVGARTLFDLAMNAGGLDNITIIIARAT